MENKVKKKRFKVWYRFLGKIAKFLMRMLWPTKIYFKENFITQGRAIAVCNHYSKMDSNAILSKLFGKKSNVVIKSEACDKPFIARIIEEIGGIPIRRGESDVSAIKKIINILNNDEQLLIFPEGTRNPQDIKEMLPFKDGAATFAIKTHSPIVPMMYYRFPRAFKKNTLVLGEPFTLEAFYGRKMHDCKDEATAFIRSKMEELRIEVDLLVEKFKGNKKKYLQFKESCKEAAN